MARRKRKNNFNIVINPKYIWLAFAVLCAILMFCTYRFPKKFYKMRVAAENVLSPMQKGINNVGKSINDRFRLFRDMKSLRKENESLKVQLNELTSLNQQLTQEKYELDSLRRLYELDSKYMDYPKVAARIIASDTNNWFYNFIIDKGTEQGIAVGMNVIAGDGLVGIVYETGKNWSRVRSIIDDNCNVSCMSPDSKDTCMVSGNLKSMFQSGVIDVDTISLDARFKENSEILTSNISDKYLPGILVGYIRNIKPDSGNMTKIAELIPAVNFNRLDEVLIITQLKDSYQF